MNRICWTLAALALAVTVWGASLESSVEIITHTDQINGTARDNDRFRIWRQFPSGTATDQADVSYTASFTLAAGASTSICLSDGTMKNTLGMAASFAHVLAITAENAGTTTITVGGHPTRAIDPTGGAIKLPGSASVQLLAPVSDGWTVTNGASDTLTISNATGGTGTLRIAIIGKSQ
jgi:hypothetical protein